MLSNIKTSSVLTCKASPGSVWENWLLLCHMWSVKDNRPNSVS